LASTRKGKDQMKYLKTILLLVLITSCSTSKNLVDVESSQDPEAIYTQALMHLENKDELEATEAFEELKRRFPQSRFTVLSELKAGDMEFQNNNYSAAAVYYSAFSELYPRHKMVDYALHQKALCYFKDTPKKIARDLSPAILALQTSRKLITRYPKSEYVPAAKKMIVDTKLKLALKEASIGNYYLRKKSYVAALKRWEKIKNPYYELDNNESPEAKELLKTAQEKINNLNSLIGENKS